MAEEGSTVAKRHFIINAAGFYIYINIYIALTLKIKSKDMLLWRNEDLWIHTELRKIRFCRTLGQF